ncbi:nitrous oxide reduction protein [Bacillus sp. HMF5848]|uniref:nitrous oxide reductase accessory protein NosL n=1 Tax=Bacillus sp. HMF5848 TaxID=2495421 RepID=UPI000F7B8487|nr:nitrous oxide reductase accessory protein NosL [Bacillus sp. HMF5848]RSK28401.1 nitrous oxide reduction protein [Bacillus sp. HMF5848]
MKRLLVFCTIILLLAGCGGSPSYEPRDINPEIDVCVICNMSVAAIDHATEVIVKNGDVYTFDDIGCMLEFIVEREQNENDIMKSYVTDFVTGEWVDFQSAHFTYDKRFWTPMAFGVIAFANEEDAVAYITEQGYGAVIDYNTLLASDWIVE